MRISWLFLLCVIVQVVYEQTDMQQEILGKWKFVKKTETVHKQETKSNDSITDSPTSDIFFKKNILLHFQDTQSMAFEIENESFSLLVSYTLKDSVLNIADSYTFHILKIDKAALLFKVENDSVHASYTYKRIVDKE
ncbi:MAG: hypothetical protein AAF611_22490 [Bacteroidota bacterium]